MALKEVANKPFARRDFLRFTGMVGAAAAFSASL
ncbi:twin-arginine translocation signal domain-containing protein [Arthrobacter sp. S41]|nr:twin-arginine translocation signal domain-containing protein [Arthrobacter sp. S41]TAP27243.1 twin-arginine translocation signal domain-containing protein [Arthrobacter sp. S41]